MTETTGSTTPAADAKTTWAVLIAIVLVAVFGLYSVFGGNDDDRWQDTEETGTRLEAAQEVVQWPASQYVEVRDDGHTLIVDGEGTESSGAGLDAIVTVLVALDVPDSVTARMDNTRALDGMQEAEWSGLTATWTYHPDNGLDIVIEDSAR